MTTASSVSSLGHCAWLVPYAEQTSSKVQLVCFPHAGGSAYSYRTLASGLPGYVRAVGVELPGHGGRIDEAPVRDVERLAVSLARAIKAHLQTPVVLFGHSMGALLAYETTRRLVDGGAPPTHLVVSGTNGPTRRSPEDPPLHQLPDAELIERLREFAGTPEAILESEEMVDLMLPTVRADFQVAETYRSDPNARIGVPLTVLGGDADDTTPLDALAAWTKHSTAETAVHVVEGGHFFVKNHPERVRAHLHPVLARARGSA